MMNTQSIGFRVGLRMIVGLCAIVLIDHMTAAQQTPVNSQAVADSKDVPRGEDEESVLHTYSLKNANGKLLVDTLASVIPDAKIAFDASSNRIVVLASPSALPRLEKVIAELDGLPPEVEFKIFSLVNSEASSMLNVISEIAKTKDVKLAVDSRTNSLLATGPKSDLRVIEAILLKLDQSDGVSRKVFRVNVVWFATEGEPAEIADDELLVVQKELSKVAGESLRPVGQATVSTTIGEDFHVECAGMLGSVNADFKIRGDLIMRCFVPHLRIEISAERNQASEGSVERVHLVNLGTTIVASLGHYVVLGTTPEHEKTLAFAVQVNSVD